MKKLTSMLLAFTIIISCMYINVSAATGQDIVDDLINNYVGKFPYVLNTHGPSTFDCSGLVHYVYKQHGVTLPYVTSADWTRYGEVITDRSQLRSGDILLFGSSKTNLNHMGVYDANGGYIIQALNSRYGIIRKPTLSEWVSSSSWNSNGSNQFQYAVRIFGGNTTSTPTFSGTADIPKNVSVQVNDYDVKVKWQSSANAEKYDVYLVQAPWGWENITHSASTTATSYTFKNVPFGWYAAFVIARPNTSNQAQSEWFSFGVSEVHKHNFITEYEKPHPHKEYQRCECGETEYTGNTVKVETCEQCNPHQHDYDTGYDWKHPHYTYLTCECGEVIYDGGTKKVSNCEECYPHEHDYDTGYEKRHPHYTYLACECGDIIYDGDTQKLRDCEECYPVVTRRTLKLQIGIPNMKVDGDLQEIDPGRGTVPILRNERTLLPIRMVVESFGAYVLWDEIDNKVTVYADDTVMEFWINSNKATVNGKATTMDVAPILINGRTFMPLRFIAENMGLNVSWNDANQTVTVEGTVN